MTLNYLLTFWQSVCQKYRLKIRKSVSFCSLILLSFNRLFDFNLLFENSPQSTQKLTYFEGHNKTKEKSNDS